jgi:hypothetical protein
VIVADAEPLELPGHNGEVVEKLIMGWETWNN